MLRTRRWVPVPEPEPAQRMTDNHTAHRVEDHVAGSVGEWRIVTGHTLRIFKKKSRSRSKPRLNPGLISDLGYFK